MKKILLVGNGAREHALAEALTNSPSGCTLFCYGQALNPGIDAICNQYKIGKLDDFEAISVFAKEVEVDFAIIGPEAPIVAGITDYLLANNGLKVLAPTQVGAQLEGSKAFTRDLMSKYNIAGLPKYKNFHTTDGIKNFIEGELGGNYVVKYDGLLGGKGVKLSGEHLQTIEEGIAYAEECLASADRVVIEEKFIGQEFSLIALSDGETLYHFPAVQDHKRAYDGDKGPNTGGMGTYSDSNGSLPFLTESDLEVAKSINQQVIYAMKQETGTPFVGVLFGGFIATPNGVGLIEYNVRFGDPECENIMNVLDTDFVDLCLATLNGELHTKSESFKKLATVCVYIVPEGYPDEPLRGAEVSFSREQHPAKAYFASVDLKSADDSAYRLVMSGSRAIAFVGTGETIELARNQALSGIGLVQGPVEHRTDIGSPDVVKAKVAMMDNLRA